MNLRGAYLQNADLRRINFTDTELTGADLKNADLRGAILVRTQLMGVDFTGADLTGAKSPHSTSAAKHRYDNKNSSRIS